MPKKSVFYSFHFDNDVMRVQQVRNMGALDGNEPVNANEWEKIKRSGDTAVKNWIQANMLYKKCVVVLIGEKTSQRPWVQYEIKKAWEDGRGLIGIHIHNLKCPNSGTCKIGENPFIRYTIDGVNMSNIVKCYNPISTDAYSIIKNNIDSWVDEAIAIRNRY